MLGRTDSGRRLLLLAVLFALVGSSLVVRLGYWQISERERLVDSARRQIYLRSTVPSRRGDILDRSGTVVLAGTVSRDRLATSAQNRSLEDRAALTDFLTSTLALTPDESDAVRAKLDSDRPYVVLATDLSQEQSEAIRRGAADAGIEGLVFETDYARTYQPGVAPGSTLAAQLLGFVNHEGEGQYGVEQRYQDVLAGTPRVVEADKDANGQPIAATMRTVTQGAPGTNLRLTIDARLQLAVEQEVMAAQIADNATSVSVVVMDPYSGELYAEATYPSFDGNDYGSTANRNASAFLDPVVSQVYEPGSVFKMLTAVAALETGTANGDTKFRDTGSMVLDGGRSRIRDADGKAMGTLPLRDGLAYSRNVVAARVAMHLAPTIQDASTTLHEVWTRFGFGAPSGIDVSGEVKGLVNDPSITAWREIDLANGSFGQGVAVTPLQLACAYGAMVNGGTLVQPHVVAAVDNRAVDVAARGQIMSPALTPQLQDLMHHVLEIPWYHDDVQMPGYWLGGKTGTAQIWDAKAHRWSNTRLNFSFVGYAGRRVGHPDLVISVKIGDSRPPIGASGSPILAIKSTELFRRVATDAMATPGLLPQLPAVEVERDRLGG